MNILVIGKFYTEGFGAHISETLEEMGHTAFRYEIGLKISQTKNKLHYNWNRVRNKLYGFYQDTPWALNNTGKSLLSFCSDKKLDLIIVCHDFLNPQQVKQLKQETRACVAMWFPDPVSNVGKAMFLDAPYDVLFFKEPVLVETLKREFRKNTFYLPECCNPRYHNKVELSEADKVKYACDITTAGNMHTARSAIFKLLTKYDVKIWGNPAPGWMDVEAIKPMIQNRFVSNEEKCKAFFASKIVLNTMYPGEISSVNVRLYEAAASNAFQLCNYRQCIDDLYVVDEEIAVFKTADEMIRKIDFYLNEPELRRRMAEKAYHRTMNEHTYKKRLEQMLKLISTPTS